MKRYAGFDPHAALAFASRISSGLGEGTTQRHLSPSGAICRD